MPPLLEAAGVLHSTPEIFVMPDDPALGEFRAVFANLLGTIEEYPRPVGGGNPGFEGATEIIGGEEMWKRLQASPADRIDSPRLPQGAAVRHLHRRLGPAPRANGDGRSCPAQPMWQPIPEDRDQAFARFEGLFLAMFRKRQPRFVAFGPEYSRIEGADLQRLGQSTGGSCRSWTRARSTRSRATCRAA